MIVMASLASAVLGALAPHPRPAAAATPAIPATPATPAAPAQGSPDHARLHKAAQAFEAIFVRELLASAHSANFGDTLWGHDQGNQTFTTMRDERFADIAAQTGAFGLARQVEAQLTARSGAAAGGGGQGSVK